LDFRDVTAAWEILSDPKLRLRYDQQLKARELAGNWEELLDAGFRSAVPWFRISIDNTAAVVTYPPHKQSIKPLKPFHK
jgi:curved DNA-binding protein CbpA